MIVPDASVLGNFVGDDRPDGHHLRSLAATADDAAIPDLADIETAAVLVKRWIDKTIAARRFATAPSDLDATPFRRYPAAPLLSRVYELRANVTIVPLTACPISLGGGRSARGLVLPEGELCPPSAMRTETRMGASG